MEMSLYGVASMNLDKLRGRDIKRRVLILLSVYAFTIIITFLMPARLDQTNFGKAKLITDDNGNEIYRMRHTYDLSKTEANNYELIITVLEAQESRANITEEMIQDMNFLKNHKFEYTVKMFECD